MSDRSKSVMPDIAAILNSLFDRHLKPNGKPHSNEDVASFARERGVEMSQAHLWNLRNKPSDPRLSHIKVIAEFFGYPPGYFNDVDVYWRVERQYGNAPENGLVDADIPVQSPGISPVLFRKVSGMSPASKALIEGLINQVSQLEGGHVRDEHADS
ncbi:hypothetical protein SK571_45535 [Lentzea sp. BCCO 10_0798]|uniref:XRE family transcriptional regulator n=1 Tax=Lentzea kristufekii TaxID=3095430 RepID=A0ABU4U7U1_9PSEU|nr:hypothetical protein [Lentzea sp. BCCO 10_0798]MDX8056675.1 hypothetical protein [Lentzea sp. BCCO 10_0798]